MDDLRDFSKLILTRCSQYHLQTLSIRAFTLALLSLDPSTRQGVHGTMGTCPPKAHFLPTRPQRRNPGFQNSLVKGGLPGLFSRQFLLRVDPNCGRWYGWGVEHGLRCLQVSMSENSSSLCGPEQKMGRGWKQGLPLVLLPHTPQILAAILDTMFNADYWD